MPSDQLSINLRPLAVVLILLILAFVLGVGIVANNDPLWFLPLFDETPLRIIVYQNGCQVDLIEGAPGFDEVTNAINQTVTHIEGFYTSYGLSDASLQHYRANELALEVIYPNPITIHAPYRFGKPDSLFFGLSSTLGDDRTIFGGHNGQYWAGAMRLQSNDKLKQAAVAVHCAR